MALATLIELAIRTTLNNPATEIASGSSQVNRTKTYNWANGGGANQASLVFADTRQIAASGNDDLDLNGSLLDALGATLNFTKIKGIFVAAADANAHDVVIGAAAANQFVGPFGAATHTIAVAPGFYFLMPNGSAAGWPVTAGTGDILRIANGGAVSAVDYDIVLVGA